MSAKSLLLLASNSPRRRQLLSLGNWMFNVVVPDTDESQYPNEAPGAYVQRLAEAKARAVSRTAHSENIIIGADTAVVDGASILGKPADMSEAIQMLARLRGHTHQVYTGLAALRMRDNKLVTDLCVTDVPMRAYTDTEIEEYALTGDPLDKAGAYAIQHPRFHPVEKLAGCYAGVMGLPMCHLVRILRALEMPPVGDVPTNCQTLLMYQCPVSRAILRGGQAG